MNNLLFAVFPFIVDAVAVVLIIIFAIIGLKKGFVNTFVSTFGSFLSIVFAIILCGVTAQFLESKFSLITSLSKSLEGVLTNIFGREIMDTSIQEATESSMAGAGFSGWLITIVCSIKGDTTIDTTKTLNEIVSPIFGYYLTVIIGFIIMFILFKLAFSIIGSLFTRLRKISLVRGADSFLGFILGAFRGVIFLALIVLVIKIIPIPFLQTVYSYIEDSTVMGFINSINIFGALLNIITSPARVIEYVSNLLK